MHREPPVGCTPALCAPTPYSLACRAMWRGASDDFGGPSAQLSTCCDSCWSSLLRAFRWCFCWNTDGCVKSCLCW